MISNLTLFFCVVWTATLLYGEKFAFWLPSSSCSWPMHVIDNPGDYVKIAVVTDPQLIDRISLNLATKTLKLEIVQFYTDIFMRRSMLASIMPCKPDMVLFLGDYFDGGHVLSDEEWQDSLNRFRHIFSLKTLERVTNNQVYFLSGNRDVGYAAYHSHNPEVINRYEKVFGPRNYHFTTGEVEFVAVDAQTLDGHPQQNQTSASWNFVSNLSRDSLSPPRVLLTHIPLYRPNWTSCGSKRSSPIINQSVSRATDDHDIVHQNYLTEDTTNKLLDSVKPVLVLSGHDHDQCTVTHIAQHGAVVEQTLGTISWRQGNLYPSFMLLTTSKITFSNASDSVSTHLCLLPAQTFIYICENLSHMLNIFKNNTKEKDEDENCEYEMVWDAEGSMHLIKKPSKIAPLWSNERVERGNAIMRSAAKKQITQEISVLMPQDVSGQVGQDAAARLGPIKTGKSNVRLVIRRLIRAFQVLSVVAAVNVPIYVMLLFNDWIDK